MKIIEDNTIKIDQQQEVIDNLYQEIEIVNKQNDNLLEIKR